MKSNPQTLAELVKQEATLQFESFTLDMAHEIGEKLYTLALKRQLPISIDIKRNGQQLYHAALEGSQVDNDYWIMRKSNVVARFGISSHHMSLILESQNKSLEQTYFLNPSEYAAHGGSFPIIIKNSGVIGSITVSGLPSEHDHALVVEVLSTYLGVEL